MVATAIHDNDHTVVLSSSIVTSVHHTATFTLSLHDALPILVFHLYSGNSSCTGTPSDETKTLISGGIESSATTVPVGGLSYLVHYNGDGTYNEIGGACV